VTDYTFGSALIDSGTSALVLKNCLLYFYNFKHFISLPCRRLLRIARKVLFMVGFAYVNRKLRNSMITIRILPSLPKVYIFILFTFRGNSRNTLFRIYGQNIKRIEWKMRNHFIEHASKYELGVYDIW
jgi:hypothetical protein